MAESTTLNQLASGISFDERQSLLQKLGSYSVISSAPLYGEDAGGGEMDFAAAFSALPWYLRVWYFVLGLLKAKPPAEIFKNRKLQLLGKRIESKTPGLYDCRDKMLLGAFCRRVETLKEASRFFYTTLDTIARDKGALFAFIASIEMPNVHRKLQTEADPTVVADNNPQMTESEIRQATTSAMEEAFGMISGEQRNAMYATVRSLNCLKGLSSFLFDRLILAFSKKPSSANSSCPINVVTELLVTLNNILFSFKVVPPLSLLQSLFVFLLQEKVGEPGFSIEKETRLLSTRAENSLAVIRSFNKEVPLTWIIRCATNNTAFVPTEISGGEDWFAVYREFWRKRNETLYASIVKNRQRQELLSSFGDFLQGGIPIPLEHLESDSNPDGIPVKGEFTLSFLRAFHVSVFMTDINQVLRPMLLEGDFVKKESRLEFTEQYNTLLNLESDIRMFDMALAPAGNYGSRYRQVLQEVTALQVKQRRLQAIIDEAQGAANKLVDQVRGVSFTVLSMLAILLEDDKNGTRTVLSNLTNIAERNSGFIEHTEKAIDQFKRLIELLNDIRTMESR